MTPNTQRPVPADHRPNGTLQIHHIFTTIQGEGPFCGERALFVRLFGCNLRCPGCDTDYTSSLEEVTPMYLVNKARELDWPEGALVVITGGEPLRQNIVPAVRKLLIHYRVQIETNGVLCPEGMPWRDEGFSVVCSPKTNRIHDEILANAVAFKYVLQAGNVNPDDGLPLRALMHPAAPQVARPRPGALVYVQPMDEDDHEANLLNLSAAIQSTMAFGHRLQVQVHKMINME